MVTSLAIFFALNLSVILAFVVLALWLSHPSTPVDADRFLEIFGKLMSLRVIGQITDAWKSTRSDEPHPRADQRDDAEGGG
ncbi:hypothetical protein M1C57_15550 [Rhodococcus pyridinivorans]|uniref:hypothetical protein n=1 Tax=Rhodococcus pyridinivorans TaxID=103816 RepID=UPI00200A1663|nr:hypothetical protein [Rhodococcus pyridinivorans]UPW03085.1 hypothetical protein M1C57_15550 [Rhodococcus pyridinivorans]